MATIYYEKDTNPETIKSLKVAVIGYGSQGHAHALNLKERGVEVCVGLYDGSRSWPKAEEQGLCVMTVEDATKFADVLMFCTPDVTMRNIYADSVKPNLSGGMTLLFAHGFNVHFGYIEAPEGVDVAMVAPKGPGHRLRGEFLAGNGLPALVAVQQDATGKAKERALAYAWGIGCARAGVLETTFKEETETDLFGEQAVLCGGVSELIKAGFETLVEAGYQPEAAYFECMHEMKLIVDLMYDGGLNYMRYSISDTAEWGDYVAGKKVIGQESRDAMRALLAKIQDGSFAKEWVEEDTSGRPNMAVTRERESSHQLETVGAQLREMMPCIDDKKPSQEA